MKVIRKISVNQLKIDGYHGLYEFEKINGNQFVVDIHVLYFYQPQKEAWKIENTIDYADLAKMAIEVFQTKTDLLETLCDKILLNILEQYSFLQSIEIHIQKLNPPLNYKMASTGVSAIYNA